MDSIHIKPTTKTPEVKLNHETGQLEIIGRSIPENSYQFYEPILNWIDSYANAPKDNTTLAFKLDYFNTSSSMYILGILKKMEKLSLSGHTVEVKWHYDEDDEDMHQTGVDLKQIVKIDIKMIEEASSENEE
ncbi:MAG: DUF1987 domain-containing protein [Cytophagales bacterium]|nr:MAG: DUF1987 domain-containing protein [Cytophagales bacterium]